MDAMMTPTDEKKFRARAQIQDELAKGNRRLLKQIAIGTPCLFLIIAVPGTAILKLLGAAAIFILVALA